MTGRARSFGAGEIDVHVGARVRERRRMLEMSQETLASAVGVTFQQQQKRESGHNRISASALLLTARVLGVGPGWFFEGLDGAEVGPVALSERDLRLLAEARRGGDVFTDAMLALIDAGVKR